MKGSFKMVKIIGFILIAVYAVWFFTVETGYVSTDAIAEEVRLMEDSTTKIKLTQTQMHKSIQNAAEKEGWHTTEFKNNALIAEKTIEDNTVAVTITFSKSEFFISPKNIDLRNAINRTLGI